MMKQYFIQFCQHLNFHLFWLNNNSELFKIKDVKKLEKISKSQITDFFIKSIKQLFQSNLDEEDKIKHKNDIKNNRDHLDSLKGKSSTEWREYATKCMIEIMDNKV